MTGSRLTADQPAQPQATDQPSPPAATKRVRPKRNPRLLLAGVIFGLVGAIAGAWLLTTISQTAAVLVAARPIAAGTVLTSQDLTTAQLPADPTIATIPAGQRESVVGQRAATDLTAGAVLAPGATTSDPVPAPEMSVVGVSLKPSQMPAMPLGVGDQVRVIVGVRDGDALPADSGKELSAEVTGLLVGEDGTTVVDLTVPKSLASKLATWVSTGRIVLILDSGAQP